jgi:hypothetical protein
MRADGIGLLLGWDSPLLCPSFHVLHHKPAIVNLAGDRYGDLGWRAHFQHSFGFRILASRLASLLNHSDRLRPLALLAALQASHSESVHRIVLAGILPLGGLPLGRLDSMNTVYTVLRPWQALTQQVYKLVNLPFSKVSSGIFPDFFPLPSDYSIFRIAHRRFPWYDSLAGTEPALARRVEREAHREIDMTAIEMRNTMWAKYPHAAEGFDRLHSWSADPANYTFGGVPATRGVEPGMARILRDGHAIYDFPLAAEFAD